MLTQVCAEMGKLDLDQALPTRQEANEALLRELDQATDPWGVEVTWVELRDFQPSRGVQQAMEQQMTAEPEKRAAILRSQGERGSQFNAARAQPGRGAGARCHGKARTPRTSSRPCWPRRADAATRLAEAMQAHPHSAEALPRLLVDDGMPMGEAMANAALPTAF